MAEEVALLDDLADLRGHHRFPGWIRRLQFGERVRGVDPEVFGIVIRDFLDEPVLEKVAIERL